MSTATDDIKSPPTITIDSDPPESSTDDDITPTQSPIAKKESLPPAPPVKPPIERIQHLEKVILDSQKHGTYTCGGTIPTDIIPCDNLTIFYKGENGPNCLNLPATPNDVDLMFEGANPSPFGKGTETVYDGTYRLAKEYKPPNVALSTEIVSTGSILSSISRKLDITRPLRAVMSKVNMYGKKGFFKPHREYVILSNSRLHSTTLGEDHVGTITVCLPSAFTGGKLVVRQDGHVARYDWSTKESDPLDPQIKWAFLFADAQHEVLPVTTGTRITVAYDVFYADTITNLYRIRQDTMCSPVYAELKQLLQGKDYFLPKGGRIAFGFRHAYPAKRAEDLISQLKGVDKLLFDAIKELRFGRQFCVVFKVNLKRHGERHKEIYDIKPSERHTEAAGDNAHLIVDLETVGRRLVHLTSSNIATPSLMDSWDKDEAWWLLKNDKNAAIAQDVIWITQVGAYGREDSYETYGNWAQAATLYTGAYVFVTIPPSDQRTVEM